MDKSYLKSRIARRLIVSIVLFSSLLALVITSFQLYSDYEHDVGRINNGFNNVLKTHLDVLVTSVWAFDENQVNNIIQGINNHPGMELVEIREGDTVKSTVGSIRSSRTITRITPMEIDYGNNKVKIGELKLVAGLDQVYQQLWDRAIFILMANAVKTFLVAGFMLLIVHVVVTRHLRTIVGYLSSQVIDKPGSSLILNKKTKENAKPDEIDEVVTAINELHDRLERSNQSLRDSEQRFRLIISRVPGIVYQFKIDSQGNRSLPYVSPAVTEYTGLTPEDVMQDVEKWFTLTHPDDLADLEASITNSMRNMTQWNWEGRFVRHSGEVHWLRGSSIPERTQDGSTIWNGVFIDNSARKAAEIALLDRERLLKAAQHVAHMGYLDWNPITNDITWSEETYGIYGFPLDFTPTLESTVKLVHPDDVVWVSAALNAAIQDKKDYNFEHRIVRPDGETIYVHAKGELTLNASGEVIRMLGTIIDITLQKKTEAELAKHRGHLEELVDERTRELRDTRDALIKKERLATLGQLTATVSHELRNPLGAMRPSLYVIEKKSDKTDERVQKAIERIDRNIDRCDRIIDELLDFTRITQLNRQTTPVDEWLESVIAEQDIPADIKVEKNYCLKNVELAFDVDRLRRAIINIVDNACHAMLGDMQPFTATPGACLGIKTGSNDTRIEIVITDTGAGIPDAVMAKIFEPLFSTKGFGVGLGMPTVKQIMEQHNGGIEIESKKDKGTIVTLWLPNKAVGQADEGVAA